MNPHFAKCTAARRALYLCRLSMPAGYSANTQIAFQRKHIAPKHSIRMRIIFIIFRAVRLSPQERARPRDKTHH